MNRNAWQALKLEFSLYRLRNSSSAPASKRYNKNQGKYGVFLGIFGKDIGKIGNCTKFYAGKF